MCRVEVTSGDATRELQLDSLVTATGELASATFHRSRLGPKRGERGAGRKNRSDPISDRTRPPRSAATRALLGGKIHILGRARARNPGQHAHATFEQPFRLLTVSEYTREEPIEPCLPDLSVDGRGTDTGTGVAGGLLGRILDRQFQRSPVRIADRSVTAESFRTNTSQFEQIRRDLTAGATADHVEMLGEPIGGQ